MRVRVPANHTFREGEDVSRRLTQFVSESRRWMENQAPAEFVELVMDGTATDVEKAVPGLTAPPRSVTIAYIEVHETHAMVGAAYAIEWRFGNESVIVKVIHGLTGGTKYLVRLKVET